MAEERLGKGSGHPQFRGRVLGADETTLGGMCVVLVTWNAGDEASIELARTVSDQHGRYELRWDAGARRTQLALGAIDDEGRFVAVAELAESAGAAAGERVEVTLRSSSTPASTPPAPARPRSDGDGDGDGDGEQWYSVSGTVRGLNNKPLREARVVVWWQQMRTRQELAAGETSAHGRYHLRSRAPRGAPQPLLLVVEAVSEHLDAPLVSPLTRAQPELTIDLALEPADRSEWAALVGAIEPLLDGVRLSELVEDGTHHDLTLLALELGKDTETLMCVAVAARLEAAFEIPAAAFFAFLRQHVPAALPSPLLDASQSFTLIAALVQNVASLIFNLSADLQKQTLSVAVALDLVGPQFTDQIPKLVSDLQAHRTTDLLNRRYLVGGSMLSELLAAGGVAQPQQQAFAKALATNTQSMRNFWRTLASEQSGLTAEEASTIERTLSIGAFVRNFVPLVQNLLQGFSSGTYRTLPDLARLSVEDWVALVNETGPPSNIDAAGTATPAEVFASVIHARVTGAYPTVAISARIAAGGFVPEPTRQPLIRFFENNPELELLKHGLPAYLAERGEQAFAGIAAEQQADVVANARRFQRVLRVAPMPDVAEALLAMGLSSATEIHALGERQFSHQATAAGLTQPEATAAYRAAAERYASVVSLYMQLNRDAIGLWPTGIGDIGVLNEPVRDAVQRDQSLATLFGSQDYCATDDCTSILSPAAYLCDLLWWLHNHRQGSQTALHVLDARRPDIRHLLLNCPNTETELPYIDLVNELLADRISPPIDAPSTSYTQSALVDGTTYYYIVTALNTYGEGPPSAQVSATPSAATTPPAPPTGVEATAGDGQVTISWDPVAGATSYNLYWSTTSGVTTGTGVRIPAAAKPFVHAALANGTTYYYIVTAVNAVGESKASAPVRATPESPVATPPAPTGLSVTAGDTELTISWDPVVGATSYNLYSSTTAGVTIATGTKITGAAEPYAQTALVDDIPCYYIVTAVNRLGEGPASAEASGTPTVPMSGPAAPTGVTALAGDGQVTISWDPVAGATSYNIYWSTASPVTIANGTKLTGSWNPRWKQTSSRRTTADLRAAPEYFNQGAYATLFAASYPFSLPYSAGLDELRTYVGQLGLPLWQLREALLPFAGGTVAQQATVAAERLKLSPHAEDVIVNATPAEVAWNTPHPLIALAPVLAFLRAAAITYESLQELLEVAWVQDYRRRGSTPPPVEIHGIDDKCTTSSQSLSPLELDFLDRAQRFLRLWLSTSYKMWELDLLLSAPAVGGRSLNQSTLAALLSFQKLQDATRLAVDQLLAFYQQMDVATHRDPDGSRTTSLYARIFLTPAVTSVAPDPDLAAVATAGSVNALLSDHLPAIQAALGVTAADAATLFALTDGQLTLANLSLLYRVTALASAAQLSISALLTVAGLLEPTAEGPATAIAPLFASPSATSEFLSQVTAIRQSHLTLDATAYLLSPPSSTTLKNEITATDPSITVASNKGFPPAPPANFYVSIGAETLLVTAASGPGDTTWTVKRGQQGTTAAAALAGATVTLSAGWPTTTQMTPSDVATALGAVRQAAAGLLSARTTLVSPIGATDPTITVASDQGFPAPSFSVAIGSEILLVTAVGGTNNTTWTVVRGQQGTTPAAAVKGAAVTPTGADLDGAVIAAVAANAHTTGGAGLANDVSAKILQTLHLPGTTQTLLATLTDPAFTTTDTPITAASFPEQFLAIRLFDKLAVLVRALRLVVSDLTWLLSNAAAYGGIDLTQLPVSPSQPARSLPPLLSTLLLIKLARLWTAAPPSSAIQTLYDIISGVTAGSLADAPAAQNALATVTGWPLADIESFATALNLSLPGGYANPAAYDALRRLEAMATTAHATGAQIVDWGTVPPDEPTAEGIAAGALGVLKAQQPTNDAWLALAPTLMDPIRERRSAALQAYLIGQRDPSGNLVYGDENGLFDHFLIDVQMSSCQLTSRVVQAYIAVQIFVERCLMNLEAPAVVVDLTQDETWSQWKWMDRYRVWEANREVFLYPENWLIESQRPNRTELYKTFEQAVQQGQSTTDYLETVVLNYISRLDDLAHLQVTGTCEDLATGDIHVVARTLAEPPIFYVRSYSSGAWGGWTKIPLDIKAHHGVPALYRGRLCLFWLDLKIANEPQQPLSPPQAGPKPPNQTADRYVAMGVNFSTFTNGSWQPAQTSKGKLFDKPFYGATAAADARTTEALYTLKVWAAPNDSGYGESLFIDVFRQGDVQWAPAFPHGEVMGVDNTYAVHLGRAVFDGRFSELQLADLVVPAAINSADEGLVYILRWAHTHYGPDAQPLLPLAAVDWAWWPLVGDSGLLPQAGALVSTPVGPNDPPTQQIEFTASGALGPRYAAGPLLLSAPKPLRVIGPDSDFLVELASYFFYQDSRRCYWVQSQKYYWSGSAWTPVAPSDPSSAPYQLRYVFHPFYHPFTRLLWHQLGSGGFDLLYDLNLQQAPDSVDPSYPDVFSFADQYEPSKLVSWDLADVTTSLAADIVATQTSITVTNDIWVPHPPFFITVGHEVMQVTAVGDTDRTRWTVLRAQGGTAPAAALAGTPVTPTSASQDRQYLDFSPGAAFGVYNWELFYHVPLYVAQLLSQNQQFEDARKWFHYIFNPTRQGSDPVPQRFWIPKPLHNLTSAAIIEQQINNLLEKVNQRDRAAVNMVQAWRDKPFNPFLLADMRPVAYMKSTVMSYLDNLISWGDNLFSTESREALSEATLLYVVASEILGPQPQAVTPPQHADESFDQLEPSLDAFANAMVEIENVIGGAGSSDGTRTNGAMVPPAPTFYFKIPSNPKLLGYWTKVAGRLTKLRHCQTIAGAPLALALFDAPIDPGLLIAAQAAGVDLLSVLSDTAVALPNYRFTALYPQALEFVGAVRAYGNSLQAALEKNDAGALTLLQWTLQQQLLTDGNQVLEWQVEQAQDNIYALQESRTMAQHKRDWNLNQAISPNEMIGLGLHTEAALLKTIAAATHTVSSVTHLAPLTVFGAAGFGGSPIAHISEGGDNAGKSSHRAGLSLENLADVLQLGADLANTIGSWDHRQEGWTEAATEAQDQMNQISAQIDAANLALQIAQKNLDLHQEQIDDLQKQIDFLNDKFTSDSLYQWMVSSLSATYFQSYRLAYQVCKALERCYRFELGIQDSSFIQFGYWDSLHKGLLAGETLNHDLRRMQASYLQQNERRFELSRYVSLAQLDPPQGSTMRPLQQLLVKGACDFELPELLFDTDYPGHYNRRLTRVSVTVVYPKPGKFDNVKATLTLVSNQVRISTDRSSGYPEGSAGPVGSDSRFIYNYAAVPQKIALGNAQDDPGLFVTTIASNIADQRYLPFENAGAISSWHLEMPPATNEINLTTIGDVVLHLYYTALDGGKDFEDEVKKYVTDNTPTSGVKVFSAQNDFPAPDPTDADPYPLTPWQAFLAPATAPDNQTLTLSISPLKFPRWTRGKKISVASITVVAIAWPPGGFMLTPQTPLPTAEVPMNPVPDVTEPNVCAATVTLPANTPPGTWSFQIKQADAADYRSLTKNAIGDVLLLVDFAV